MSDLKDSMLDSDDSSEDTDTALSIILQRLAFDDFSIMDKPKEDSCACEFCNERRNMSSSKVEELKMIQTYWMEFRQYIRMVYRLSMKGSLKSIDDEYRCYMKDLVGRLYELCNPHQLYQRLEDLVREFVVEVKVRMLQLLDRLAENPQLPKLFISGMLERYHKMMVAVDELTPILHQLETEHLSKFNLTWRALNQRLFHTSIYADTFFQSSIPLFINQLGKGNDSDENKRLVKDFLSFDDDITLVDGMWAEVESRIKLYTQNQTLNFARHRFLADGWHEIGKHFEGQDKLCFKHAKALENYLCSSEMYANAHDDKESIVLGACECHVTFSTDEVDSSNRASSNDESKCGGNEKPSAAIQKNRSSVAETTVDSSDLNYGHTTSDKPTINVDSSNQLLVPGKGQPFKRRADQMSTDHESTCTLENRIKASKILREFSCTDYLLPHCLKHGHNSKRLACSEYHALNNLGHVQNSGLPDSFSSDAQHCDCCYCEVFGQGMPASAPMSKNYKEMRERLRLLLNKKKSKRRTPSGQSTNSSKLHSNMPLVSPTPKITKKAATPDTPPVIEKETRSVDDLLDFIEGIEVKSKNEKKAAKKARQKEKKQSILDEIKKKEEEKARKLEEERLRKEREAAILEAAKNAQKMALKKKKVKSRTKDDPVTNEKKNNMSYGNQPYQISGGSNSGSQIVTIKRVMEPHDSEPTVTITLRGATPKQDKVLYTLFNGQVCDSASSKNTKEPPVSKKAVCDSANSKNTKEPPVSKKAVCDSANSKNTKEPPVSKKAVCDSANSKNTKEPPVSKKAVCDSANSKNTKEPPVSKKAVCDSANSKNTKEPPVSKKAVCDSANSKNTKEPPVSKKAVCDSANSKNTKEPPVSKKDLKPPPVSSKKPSGKNGAPTQKVAVDLKREPKKVEREATTSVPKSKLVKNNSASTKSPSINNSSTSAPKNGYRAVSFNEIKLPPGITITKVDPEPSKVKQTSKVPHEAKLKQGATHNGPKSSPKYSSSPEVTVVSTKNKSKSQSNSASNNFRGAEPRPSSYNSSSSKKPKKRKETEGRGEVQLHPVTPSSNISSNSRSTGPASQKPFVSNDSSHEDNNKSANGAKKKEQKAKKTLDFGYISVDAEEWYFLDNVFAPKHLDLDDTEIDDAERELEAFKLFCMQSVPLPHQQKEKVNLNLQDLVLKKKSPISCN